MTATPHPIPVSVTVHPGEERHLLICDQHLDGDTFLHGWLQLDGEPHHHPVRIHTFDRHTVLELLDDPPTPQPGTTRHGLLQLAHGGRFPAVPPDLGSALTAAAISIEQFSASHLAHLLHWLTEARDPTIRAQRISHIVIAATQKR